MQNHHTKHTPNTIAAALSRIPPNLPRDEWTRLGMAIKAHPFQGVWKETIVVS